MRLGRLFAAALIAAALFTSLSHAAPANPRGDSQLITAVEWTPVAPGASPSPDAQWTSQSLPWRWRSTSPQLNGIALRLRFVLNAQPRETWAVLLPVVTTGGRFLVNGHSIGDIQSSDAVSDVHWRDARMLAIDPGLLRAGDNAIVVLTSYRDDVHALAEVEIGPMAQLSTRYHRLLFVSFTLPWIGATVALMLAALFAVMWRRRPQFTLVLLTLSAVAWAVCSITLTFDLSAVETRTWTLATTYLTVGIYAAAMTAALMRLAGRKNRRDYSILSALALAGPVVLVATERRAWAAIDRVWLAALILVPTAAFLYSLSNRLRSGARVSYSAAIAVVAVLAAACHDYAVLRGWLPGIGFQALHVAAPLLLLIIAAPLVDRFLRALRDTESERSKLEVRVREREQMLKYNFERIRQDERAQDVLAERQRIMQDMHDGLGSQLLSSLMLVERGALKQDQVAQVLRECIDDMRLAIDTLTQQEADFLAAVGNLRYRLEPRFSAAGIRLKWDMRDLPDELNIDHHAILPILRILQEALTNTMKHSRADTVVVEMKVDASGDTPRLMMRVADNGVGTLEERPGSRGIKNMRSRAARIDAELRIEATPGSGTEVRLIYGIKGALAGGTSGMRTGDVNTDVIIEHFRAK